MMMCAWEEMHRWKEQDNDATEITEYTTADRAEIVQ